MDALLVGLLVAVVSYVVLNNMQKKKRLEKATEVGAEIYDRIIASGQRPASDLPLAEDLGCAVAAFAANAGVPSTFTSKGEPLGKYKLRQMIHDFLPPKYQSDRAYFNCANVEATVFWIAYMERFFLESLSRIYQPDQEWRQKFHEYYWKFSIYNMLVEMRKPDVPMFLAKVHDAFYVRETLNEDSLYSCIRQGARLPDGFTGNDGSFFPGYDSVEGSRKVRSILASSAGRVFREKTEQQAKNLVSLYVPEVAGSPFDIDDDDRKLTEIVDKSWESKPNGIDVSEYIPNL